MVKGYAFRAPKAPDVDGKPAWYGRVRRKNWAPGYWVTVSSGYGPIVYTSPEYAIAAARLWASENERGGPDRRTSI